MATNESDKDINPAYLPFATFQSALQNLRDHGLPNRIDKSAFGTRSGADQHQIMGAFRFLGLINSNDETQEPLQTLHDAQANSQLEKDLLAGLLKVSYAQVFAKVDLKSATPAQLEEAIADFGVKGSTKTRAVRFFIKAAEYCNITLSGRLTHGARSRPQAVSPTTATPNGTVTPKRVRRSRRQAQPNLDQQYARLPQEAAMKTIKLPMANGTLTLSGSFNPFELVGEERKLVYGIIDSLNEYEKMAAEK